MVKDHSDSERGNPLPPLHGIYILYEPSNREDSKYHGPCYTSREPLGGIKNSQWVNHEGSYHEQMLYNLRVAKSFVNVVTGV